MTLASRLQATTLSTRLAAAMAILVLLTAAAMQSVTYRSLETAIRPAALERTEIHAQLLAADLQGYVRGAHSDVLGFRAAASIDGIIRARLAGGVHPADGTTEAAWRARMAARFVGELESKPAYLRFRIIGIEDEGREIVRVERAAPGGEIRVAADSELQRKGERDYFADVVRLPPGQAYVSPIDLNQENGAIETPHVPVLRVATPLHGPAGQPFGVLIVNLDMRPAFARIRSAASAGGHTYVVNEAGDYLLHPAPDREFGFELGRRSRMQDEFPDLAAALAAKTADARMIDGPDGGRFGAAIAPVRIANEFRAAVIETVPHALIMAPADAALRSSLAAGLVAVLAAAVLAALLARSLARPLGQMTGAVAAFARGEPIATPISAGGEIGVLARAFARMAVEVRDNAAALRRKEAERRQAGVAIERGTERERLYLAAVESCPSGMVMIDASGKILLVNAETEKLFGYQRGDLLGQSVDILVPARYRGQHPRHRETFAAHPGTRAIGAGRDLFGLRKDGTEFPVEIGLNPIRTRDGLVILSVIIDISERKRNERLKDEFVATVSHELRTPLTSIAGSLGLLIGNGAGKLPEPTVRLLAIAHKNSQRLVRLINDILDMEKIESGRVVFDLEQVELRSLAEQAIEDNRGFAEGYAVAVRLDPASVACQVSADPDRLLQVITNLLSNAIKFSPRDNEVVVAIEHRDNAVRMTVRDHGPGIPDEFKSRVFDKFAQADACDARQKGGTGLGLSIVKQIVTRLGGEVGFADASGGGTVFHVELPACGQTAIDQSGPAAEPAALQSCASAANGRPHAASEKELA
jgi:PAS domain S-box-containing protein